MVGSVKDPNCQFTFVQVVKLLILFPFFSVKNAADYAARGLGKLFSCKKGIACNPFELIENVINNNNQIKAVEQALDWLDLAETAA